MDEEKKSPDPTEPDSRSTDPEDTVTEKTDAPSELAARLEGESDTGAASEAGESAPAGEPEVPSAAPGGVGATGEKPAGEETSAQPVYCIRCGAAMLSQDRFCHACGWKAGVEPPPPLPPRVVSNPSEYNRLTAILLCVLLGWLGVHRFYVGKFGTGILWLLTGGLLVVGAVYDLVLIATGEFRDAQGKRIVQWN